MSTAKVTHLSDRFSQVASNRDNTRLQALSSRFSKLLPPLLDSYFTAADDFLFQWAEKTRDGVASAAYFEHLRALRLEKDAIRTAILSGVQDLHKRQLTSDITESSSVPNVSMDDLSLMEDETLERGLAIDSFANRVLERSGNEWLAFRERLGFLVGAGELSDEQTPFNPRDFGKVVFEALERLQCPLKTILMLYRLFDQKACAKLTVYYESGNRWLVEEGILPNLKLMNAHNSAPIDRPETFEQLGSMLAQRATGEPGSGAPAGSGGGGLVNGAMNGYAGASASYPAGGALHDQPHLMATLSHIQSQDAPSTTDVMTLKSWIQSQAQAVSTEAKGSDEAGTVSLVAMLFEYILDDAVLSPHMKQLMARMQIPIIKVALLDKTFFTESEHSARRLLNKMAKAAIGWEPESDIEDDILLDGMETIVSRLNHEFETDLTMFDAALDEFTAVKDEYDAMQSARVAVLRKEEDDRVREHDNQDRARLFIEALLKDEAPPAVVLNLMQGHWYRLMKGIFNRHGEGKAWKTSARIARELMWSVQPNVQLTEATRFKKVVPGVLSGLKDGLKALGVEEAERERMIEQIESLHANKQSAYNEDVWEAQEKLDAFEERSREAEAIVEQPQPLPVDEPVVQHKPADLTYYMDIVASLETDSWFDIEVGDGEVRRGCLSCIVAGGSKYLFTDYQGHKIAERSAIGLAIAMRNDSIRPLDSAPLFDRMINTLVNDLGHSQTRH